MIAGTYITPLTAGFAPCRFGPLPNCSPSVVAVQSTSRHLRSSRINALEQGVIADAGHQSRKLARTLKQDQGWQLRIVKRRQRAFKITGLTWIVERSFAWLGRNRRLSKDYEYRVQTSETMIDLASIRLMLNRIALA